MFHHRPSTETSSVSFKYGCSRTESLEQPHETRDGREGEEQEDEKTSMASGSWRPDEKSVLAIQISVVPRGLLRLSDSNDCQPASGERPTDTLSSLSGHELFVSDPGRRSIHIETGCGWYYDARPPRSTSGSHWRRGSALLLRARLLIGLSCLHSFERRYLTVR